MDPVSTAVVKSAAGKIGDKVFALAWNRVGEPLINKMFADYVPVALDSAKENMTDFLRRLAAKVEQIDAAHAASITPESIAESLRDPDVAMALHEGMVSAARSPSGERHEILASMVLERLRSSSDSDKAVIAVQSIGLMANISAPQLRLLGLLAVAYCVGSRVKPALTGASQEEQVAALTKQAIELARIFDRLGDPPVQEVPAVVHLLSVGALIASTADPKELAPRLEPVDVVNTLRESDWLVLNSAKRRRAKVLSGSPNHEWLHLRWRKRPFAGVRLAPVGLLIGIAVVDAIAGTAFLSEWEWGDLSSALDFEAAPTFGDELRSSAFSVAVNDAVEQKAREIAAASPIRQA